MKLSAVILVAVACVGSYGFVRSQYSIPDIEGYQKGLFRGYEELERNGAFVVGEEDEELGKIARRGSDALGDEYSAGSSSRANGLFNRYGKYGSEYARTSAFSPTANRPPLVVIRRGNQLYEVGVLTVNPSAQTRGQRIDPRLLKVWLDSH